MEFFKIRRISFTILCFTFFILISCASETKSVSRDGVLALIPDSLQDQDSPLVDFLFHEIKNQYSLRIRLVDENGQKWPFHGSMNLNKDSLDRLLLKGWTIEIDTIPDLSILTDKLLAEDIMRSLEIRNKYPWNRHTPDSIFRRYLLPYKIVHEYPELWWSFFTPYYRDSLESFANHSNPSTINISQPAWLHYNTVIVPKGFPVWWRYKDNIPRFTKYPSLTEQMVFKEGGCYLEAINNVRILRTCGLPATIDEVPYWGSKNGSHASAVFWDNTITGFRTGIERAFYNREEARRPAKVMRYTFHRTGKYDKEVKPFFEGKNFAIQTMQSNNWLDVTSNHTKVSDIKITVDSVEYQNNSLGYIYVLNYGEWVPVFYGKVQDDTLIFKDMGREDIYRIGFRNGEKNEFITPPFLVDRLGNIVYSNPNFSNAKNVLVHKINHGKEAYVKKGISYHLQYMDTIGAWIDHEAKLCKEDGKLVLKGVPKDAFFILRPAMDDKNLSRIFLINEQGEQVWY